MAIKRAALGRSVALGALYDARGDVFLNDNLLKVEPSKIKLNLMDKANANDKEGANDKSIEIETTGTIDTVGTTGSIDTVGTTGAIDSQYLGSYNADVKISDKFTERANNFGIDAELQASILSGMISLKGSAKYLQDDKDSTNFLSMDFICKAETFHEEITLRRINNLYIDSDVLKIEGKAQKATHVVVAIDWGADCIVSCKYSNSEGKSHNEIKGAFEGEISKLKGLTIKGEMKGGIKTSSTDISKEFTFSVKSDLIPANLTMPVTFEEAVNMAQNIQQSLKATNNGKGIPKFYYMIPLDEVMKMCKIAGAADIHSLYRQMEEGKVRECTQRFENLLLENTKFAELRKLFHSQSDMITKEKLKEIDDINKEFELLICKIRSKFQKALREERSERQSEHNLMNELESEISDRLHAVMEKVKHVEEERGKLTKAAELKKRGFVFVTNNNLHILDFLHQGFVVYLHNLEMCSNTNKIFQKFSRLRKDPQYTDCQFLIVLKKFLPDVFERHVKDDKFIIKYKDSMPIPLTLKELEPAVNCYETETVSDE